MAPAPLRAPAHVPLVHFRRGGMVEGVHHGSAVVLLPDGSTLVEAGDVDTACYPRSAVKPLQAVAMVAGWYAVRGRIDTSVMEHIS